MQFCKASELKPIRPIRNHAIRWGATYNMLQRALYLRKAIDSWTRSKSDYSKLILTELEWEMCEFLVHFLGPFHAISILIQGTARASLHDTWVKYEEMFNCLDEVTHTLNEMTVLPPWIREVQTAIEKMWSKLLAVNNS